MIGPNRYDPAIILDGLVVAMPVGRLANRPVSNEGVEIMPQTPRWLLIGLAAVSAIALKFGEDWLALFWALLIFIYATDNITGSK
jgi:hypothetical protein